MFRFISACFILGLGLPFGFGDQDLNLAVGQPNNANPDELNPKSNQNILPQTAAQNDPFDFLDEKENLPPLSLFSSALLGKEGQRENLPQPQLQPPQAQEVQHEKDPFDFSFNSQRVEIKDNLQPPQPGANEKDPFALLSSSSSGVGVGVREKEHGHGFQELPDQNQIVISNTNFHPDIDNQIDPFGFLSSPSETDPSTIGKENGLQKENLFQKSKSNVDIQPQSQSRSDPTDPFSNLFAKYQSKSARAPALLGSEISKDLNPASNNQNSQPAAIQAGVVIEDRDDSSDADIDGPLGGDSDDESWYHNPDRESNEDIDVDPGFDNNRDDRENDYDTDDREDHNNDQHYSGKFPGMDNLDEVKESRPPTAPTNMVLFYTWMILAILVMVVVVSTYQAKCKGFLSKDGRQQARGGGEDKKRLLDNEYV